MNKGRNVVMGDRRDYYGNGVCPNQKGMAKDISEHMMPAKEPF